MSLRDIVDGMRQAAAAMGDLASNSQKVVDVLDKTGSGGPDSGGGSAPPTTEPPLVINFNNTITTSVNRTTSDAPNRAGSLLAGEEIDKFILFLRTKGIYDADKVSEQTIKALRLEFDRLLKAAVQNANGLTFRKMGLG